MGHPSHNRGPGSDSRPWLPAAGCRPAARVASVGHHAPSSMMIARGKQLATRPYRGSTSAGSGRAAARSAGGGRAGPARRRLVQHQDVGSIDSTAARATRALSGRCSGGGTAGPEPGQPHLLQRHGRPPPHLIFRQPQVQRPEAPRPRIPWARRWSSGFWNTSPPGRG